MDLSVRGIVFDKDGTLFDFDKTWGVPTKAIIERECGRDSQKIAALSRVLGYDMKRCVFLPGSLVIGDTAEAVAEAILPFTQETHSGPILDRIKAITSEIRQVQVTDLKRLFDDLRQRGLKLGIATNDAELPARANLAQADVLDAFAFIAGFDSGFGGKPQAGQLVAFCGHVNLSPNQCVMVGDSLHDLKAGRSVGMRTIGVLTGPASRLDLSPYADVVLETIAEIPTWLDQL